MAILGLLAGAEASPTAARAESNVYTVESSDAEIALLLGVAINGREQDKPKVFIRRNGNLLVSIDALREWNIHCPDLPVFESENQKFVPMTALRGLAYKIDDARQELELTVPAALFRPTELSAALAQPTPTDTVMTAFLNYDLSLERTHGAAKAAAFLVVGVSDDWGLASNSMTIGHGEDSNGAVRLDSYFLHDDPGGLTRLVVGDTLTRGNDWSPQLRFGGIRFGTEFGLQPGLVTFPTPTFAGRTALPSSVELYVNEALRYRGQVGPGPYSIGQVPLVTGAGEVTIFVRDTLGVERRVTSRYYVSSNLLRMGHSDYTVEIGAERRGYGVTSFDYGPPFAAAGYRRGVTDWLTLEGRVEASPDVRTVGGSFNAVWPLAGEFGMAAAVSHGEAGTGSLYRVYFSRIEPAWSFSLSYQHSSRGFAQIGVHNDTEKVRAQLQVAGGLSFGRLGSVSAAYTDLRFGDGNRARIGSVNYSTEFGERAYLNTYVLRSVTNGSRPALSAGLGLTISFGRRSSAFVQADNRNRSAEYRQMVPTKGGWGYRFAFSAGELNQQQAAVSWRGPFGDVSAQFARDGGETSARVLASGGLIVAGRSVFATRRVEGGYGLVEVPGAADVRIYQDNREVTRTNRHGQAIIPDLRPYEENRISLAAGDLPLETRMGSGAVVVVPRFFSGVRARFDVSAARPGTIAIQLADGRPIEAGTPVVVDDGRERLFSGYDGEIFVSSIHDGMIVDVRRPEGVCRAVVDTVPADAVLPRLGPILCKGTGEVK